MISKAKKILSSFILSSIILSSIGFSASASNSETPVLKEDSLYIVNDNYIEDVIDRVCNVERRHNVKSAQRIALRCEHHGGCPHYLVEHKRQALDKN